MQISDSAQALINKELEQLVKSSEYSLQPQTRITIYEALGYSNVEHDRVLEDARNSNSLPHLSLADLCRAHIALATARKVAPLWDIACQESEVFFKQQDWQDKHEDQHQEEIYLRRRKTEPIENISVYEVPRAFVPSHILEMAESALTGNIQNYDAFQHEANEWWQIYGRPEHMEREYFIKWATQDALYETIGWVTYNHEPPAENALYAFAGVFEGAGFNDRRCIMDKNKEREFWLWWLSEAIPQSVSKVDVS